ncbi:MAG: GIY-YIG nuclease family protein [Patescibacteria group bacterium]
MPNATTSIMFFYVYALEGLKDKKRYIGYTVNLREGLEKHRKEQVFSTKPRLPMKLIYFEACTNQDDAQRRGKYFKTTRERRFLAKRLKSYYQSRL